MRCAMKVHENVFMMKSYDADLSRRGKGWKAMCCLTILHK